MDDPPTIASATLNICRDGLLLTAGEWWAARYLMRQPVLHDAAECLHARQPTMASYDDFADTAAEVVLDWAAGEPLGIVWMACADLCETWEQINYAALLAVEATRVLHEVTIGSAPADYPWLVPPGLDGLRADGVITAQLLRRVLAVAPWCGYLERLRAQCRRTLALFDAYDVIKALRVNDLNELLAADSSAPVPPARRREPPRYPTAAVRRSLRRAIRFYERRIGDDGLRQFLRCAQPGETKPAMTIRGTYYDFRLARTDSVLQATAEVADRVIRFNLTIHNKLGVRLCDGCVVFDGLPIIDQIIALALHLRNPETEIELLRRMHLSLPTTAFYQDPMLPELSGLRALLDAPTTLVGRMQMAMSGGAAVAYYKSHLSLACQLVCDVAGLPEAYLRVLRAGEASRLSVWNFVVGDPDAIDWMQPKLPDLARAADCLR